MQRLRSIAVPAALALLLLAALVFALLASGGSSKSPSATATAPAATQPGGGPVTGQAGFAGAALPRPVPAPGFTLSDQHGRTVSLAQLRGQPVVLAFLYPSCGATCVLIAQQIRGAIDEVDRPVHVVLVSADPAADTPQSVRAFLAHVSLSGRALYLSGSPAALAAVWRAYHVKPASSGASTFADYATVTLIDPRGRERVLYGQEQLTPEALAHDIRAVSGRHSTR